MKKDIDISQLFETFYTLKMCNNNKNFPNPMLNSPYALEFIADLKAGKLTEEDVLKYAQTHGEGCRYTKTEFASQVAFLLSGALHVAHESTVEHGFLFALGFLSGLVEIDEMKELHKHFEMLANKNKKNIPDEGV